jgi:3-dehydroquinate synthase
MRGIPYIQAPTTLLAQVDSSIGGKTGVDLPSGKNLLGTFCQPKGVFCDLAFLATLPPEEFQNGLAEIVKYGLIEEPALLQALETEAEALHLGEAGILKKVVTRSCRIKKGIIEIDETEKGLRRILNFGHTIGHAVEAESGYRITHGHGVAMGMVAAARLSEAMSHLPGRDCLRIETALQNLGLPCRIPANLETDHILARIGQDKKKQGVVTPFVLLKKIGMPFISHDVPAGLVKETIEALKA